MKLMVRLIQLHKIIFAAAMAATCISVCVSLCWNHILARLIDGLGNTTVLRDAFVLQSLPHFLLPGIAMILAIAGSEVLASVLASYTCEIFAHEMRMGYARYFLHMDHCALAELNVGEAQSAMQNELRESSAYLNENLFALAKQALSFLLTVVFLLQQNPKLAVLSILPVLPVIVYCAFSSKKIREYTEQCQECKKQINGLSDILLTLFPVIRVYQSHSLFETIMEERLAEWKKANVRTERIAAVLMSLSGVLSFLPLLCLLAAGGVMVIRGEISVGVFYIFINLSGNVSGFLQNMPNIYAGFRRFTASVARLESRIILQEKGSKL